MKSDFETIKEIFSKVPEEKDNFTIRNHENDKEIVLFLSRSDAILLFDKQGNFVAITD